jgi:hypothetical protein
MTSQRMSASFLAVGYEPPSVAPDDLAAHLSSFLAVDYEPQIIASLPMLNPPHSPLRPLTRKYGKTRRREDYEPQIIESLPMCPPHSPLRPLTPKYGKE